MATLIKAPKITKTTGRTSRFYDITDAAGQTQRYPSVTTILGAINKPALVGWAAKEERTLVTEAAAALYADTQRLATPLPSPAYLLALEQRLGQTKAHVKALQQAADIGTQAHHAIEHALRAQLGVAVGPAPVLPDAALWAFMAFEDFAKDVALTPLAVEQVVYSHTHQYAGTLDLVADLDAQALLRRLERQGPVETALGDWLRRQGAVRAVVDFKTGKAIYAEAFMQTVAYERALAEMGHGRVDGIRVDGGLIVRLPKLTTDPDFEVAVAPPARALFGTFLAVRQLWDWTYAQEQAYQVTRRKVA
jgi:hypothetical protein